MYINTFIYVYTSTPTHLRTYVYTYLHTYVHASIHTHIHTYIYRRPNMKTNKMLHKAHATFNFLQFNFQLSAFPLCLQTSVQRT